jgi:hypothetical protein
MKNNMAMLVVNALDDRCVELDAFLLGGIGPTPESKIFAYLTNGHPKRPKYTALSPTKGPRLSDATIDSTLDPSLVGEWSDGSPNVVQTARAVSAPLLAPPAPEAEDPSFNFEYLLMSYGRYCSPTITNENIEESLTWCLRRGSCPDQAEALRLL